MVQDVGHFFHLNLQIFFSFRSFVQLAKPPTPCDTICEKDHKAHGSDHITLMESMRRQETKKKEKKKQP